MIVANRELSVIILAAGKGNRMSSSLPKSLHTLAGKAILQYVIDTATQLCAANIYLVYSKKDSSLLRKNLIINQDFVLNWVLQTDQFGTGHAVQQVMPYLHDEEEVLILYGDVPLISFYTLRRLLEVRSNSNIAFITAIMDKPDGYGRILRVKDNVIGIIEQKEANEQQMKIKEVNTGILAAGAKDIKRWLQKLTPNNKKNELYLTDIIAIAKDEKCKIKTVQPENIIEVKGVNNKIQLACLERLYQQKQAESLLLAGVMLSDPDNFNLRGILKYGQDVFIDTQVLLEGHISLGNRVIIGLGCILKNVIIGDDVIIKPYTIIEGAIIAAHNIIGPFAHIRPGSKLEKGVRIGNFVEIKESCLGKNSKIGHLSYLGDSKIGTEVNIGAGTITCNYDGINKHKTIIGNNVFIGADSQLVAPVTVGDGATIGAGTTVTKDIASGEMIISRIHQFPIINWTRPTKKK